MKSLVGLILIILLVGGEPSFTLVKTYPVPEAKQAVAADATHFYAIDDAAVAKYDMEGNRVALWEAGANSHIKHLNSGFVKDGKLYMAHSNYPELPRKSTIEILDTKSMTILQTHDFEVTDGAANVVLWHGGYWWVLFAHYSGSKAEPGRNAGDTRLDKLDANWNRLASYTFPEPLVQKFQPKSISGAAFGPDGYLYCTGHDTAEVYRLNIPVKDSVLEHLATIAVACEGQGIAWQGNYLYTIKRSTREVVVFSYK